jgi:hypothetical protein
MQVGSLESNEIIETCKRSSGIFAETNKEVQQLESEES